MVGSPRTESEIWGPPWAVEPGWSGLAGVCGCAREVRATFEIRGANGANGSTVVGEPALRPELSPQARMPPTTRSASRGGRRGLLVLTAGLACALQASPVAPPASGCLRPVPIDRAGSRLLPARLLNRRMGRRLTMMGTEHDRAARRRGELARDRGSRRVSSAIDARAIRLPPFDANA